MQIKEAKWYRLKEFRKSKALFLDLAGKWGISCHLGLMLRLLHPFSVHMSVFDHSDELESINLSIVQDALNWSLTSPWRWPILWRFFCQPWVHTFWWDLPGFHFFCSDERPCRVCVGENSTGEACLECSKLVLINNNQEGSFIFL